MNKAEARKRMKDQRERLSEDQIISMSNLIFEKIRALSVYRNSPAVHCYASFRNEVRTWEFMKSVLADGKRLAVPRVTNTLGHEKEMEFYYIEQLSELKQGAYGIMEPEPWRPANTRDALVIVPGLAFDRKLNRLGYGGGYYDRYFSRFPLTEKTGVCYNFQIMDEWETDCFDMKMDRIITPERKLP